MAPRVCRFNADKPQGTIINVLNKFIKGGDQVLGTTLSKKDETTCKKPRVLIVQFGSIVRVRECTAMSNHRAYIAVMDPLNCKFGTLIPESMRQSNTKSRAKSLIQN